MTDAAAGKPNSAPSLGRFGSFGRGVTPQPPHRPGLSGAFSARYRRWSSRGDQRIPRPYAALVDYLDRLDDLGVPAKRRVVAALGPRVLGLSAQRSAGAHPYLTTPEHTARARILLGPSAFLAPEHKVVLTTDAEMARSVSRRALEIYLNLANYLNNWKRLGFTDDDVTRPGSDRLVDALVAYGTTDAIAARLHEHLDAGADHVAIQVLTRPEKLVPALAELAGPLGLNPA